MTVDVAESCVETRQPEWEMAAAMKSRCPAPAGRRAAGGSGAAPPGAGAALPKAGEVGDIDDIR
ncbi:MAG TPA: hypothetical protein VHR45_09765 [Thermoanaerobaculia bacterium]|nr:hypothetical protein [Thermoanaerobaculia bacterium]